MREPGICVHRGQDELIDDRPALATLGETDPELRRPMQRTVGSRTPATRGRSANRRPARCLPRCTLDPVAATLRTRTRDGHADAAATAEQSVRRFADAVLGLAIT